ncbi:MAG: hypothetical protein WD876_03870 [Candidatus Pacearchaeota archaeon]
MTEDKQKGDLEKLKKEYGELRKKYSLPEYSKLADDFNGIERASDVETDYLIREIRRYVADKLFNFHRFVEALLNPQGVPMHIFSMIKTLGPDEKKKLSDIYKEIAKIELMVMEVDLDFSEKKEAELIKYSFDIWQKIKKDFSEVLAVVRKNWDVKADEGRRDYFG